MLHTLILHIKQGLQVTDDTENHPFEDIILFYQRKINIHFLGYLDHEVK